MVDTQTGSTPDVLAAARTEVPDEEKAREVAKIKEQLEENQRLLAESQVRLRYDTATNSAPISHHPIEILERSLERNGRVGEKTRRTAEIDRFRRKLYRCKEKSDGGNVGSATSKK